MSTQNKTASSRLAVEVSVNGAVQAADYTPNHTTNGTSSQHAKPEIELPAELAEMVSRAAVPEDTEPAGSPGQVAIEAPGPVFKGLTYDELLNRPDKKWLIEGVIGEGDQGITFGAPGSGKTFVIIDMILDAIAGNQWAGIANVVRPLRVAYAAGEGSGGLKARFEAAVATKNLSSQALSNLLIFLDPPQLFEGMGRGANQFVSDYRAAHGEQALDLLVIDTLHSATVGAEENSAKDAGKILQSVKYLSQALQCAVMVVHHTNKAGTGERGSSAFRGAMDCMLEVIELGNKHLLKCSKLKDGEPFKDQKFSLVAKKESVFVFWEGESAGADGRKNESGADILKVLSEEPESSLTIKRIGEAIGSSQQAAGGVLARLENEGKVQRSKGKANGREVWHYTITELGIEALQKLNSGLLDLV